MLATLLLVRLSRLLLLLPTFGSYRASSSQIEISSNISFTGKSLASHGLYSVVVRGAGDKSEQQNDLAWKE